MSYTPGPWELVSLSGYGSPFSVRMPYIAETAEPNQTHYGVQSIRRREDALLIVASPELLEILKDVVATCAPVSSMARTYVERARAVIAKAEGRT